jgi:hypothetical protein
MRWTLVQCSRCFVWEELWKSRVFLSRINISERVARECYIRTSEISQNRRKLRRYVKSDAFREPTKLWSGNIEAMHRKRPELWPNDWIPNRDSVPSYKALTVKHFLVEKSVTEYEHLHYSTDMASNDFQLFLKINSAFKGWIFQDFESIQGSPVTEL